MGDGGNRDQLRGTEWDFPVHDRDGSIALLSTAGAGPIPPAILSQRESMERAIDELRALPLIGESLDRRAPDLLNGDYSEWFEYSKRGVFTFDWRLHRGPYDRVSAPTVPLVVSDAGPRVAAAAALYGLPLSFAEAAQLHIEESDH